MTNEFFSNIAYGIFGILVGVMLSGFIFGPGVQRHGERMALDVVVPCKEDHMAKLKIKNDNWVCVDGKWSAL